jgi:LysM repeat protein
MFFEIFRKVLPLSFLVLIVWGIVGCKADKTDTPISVSMPISLNPYSTPTASQTPEGKLITQEIPTQPPTVTPTPMVYTIVEGDTMLAIAFRYGISLAQLQSANPEVNARLLVVGTELIIPLGDVLPSNPVTATPIPLQISGTICYPAPDGIWCFVTIKNDRSRALENISAQVVLQDSDGDFIAEGTAYGAMNLLPVDEELPLVLFIPGRYSTEFEVTAIIQTVQPLPKNDERYLNAWLEVDQVKISEGGKRAQISGTVGLPVKSEPGNLAWILVVAYDQEGNVVGVRKAEQFGIFEPGSSREFFIEVFSLASSISEVSAFVEVRP